jgi:hypothetical protein
MIDALLLHQCPTQAAWINAIPGGFSFFVGVLEKINALQKGFR